MNEKGYPIDLNADLGEGGDHDSALLQLITSANIACGGHAGDQTSMEITVRKARQYKVNIGAHPSYPDRVNFGRVQMKISPEHLTESLYQQISALKAVCEAQGAKLFHVKPHGAFYNQAAYSKHLGLVLIKVIQQIDQNLKLMILADSPLVTLAKEHGLAVIEEAFADRAYLSDGSLAPRNMSGAVLESDNDAIQQVEKIITKQSINTLDAGSIVISADTICLHGDNAHALIFAKLISQQLTNAN